MGGICKSSWAQDILVDLNKDIEFWVFVENFKLSVTILEIIISLTLQIEKLTNGYWLRFSYEADKNI